MKHFVISLFISGILFYFAFRGVDWSAFKEALGHMDYPYLLVVVPLFLLIQWMRSYRWGLILKPITEVDQGTLFSITSVGFMGILLLPGRTGELLRPYLISQQKDVDLRSALATIVVERVLDGLTIMGFFVWIILFIPLPTFVITFAEGLQILPDLKSLGLAVGLSLIVLALMGLNFYILLQAFHMKLPLIACFAVLVIVLFGVMIPGAPGFVGNFHLSCVLGLSLFGIPRSEAFSYAIVNHLIVALFTVALGVIFLPRIKISWPDLFKKRGRSGF